MVRPREVIIRIALEYFKGMYKLHQLETRIHFLQNIFTISDFLFNTFKILNAEIR